MVVSGERIGFLEPLSQLPDLLQTMGGGQGKTEGEDRREEGGTVEIASILVYSSVLVIYLQLKKKSISCLKRVNKTETLQFN